MDKPKKLAGKQQKNKKLASGSIDIDFGNIDTSRSNISFSPETLQSPKVPHKPPKPSESLNLKLDLNSLSKNTHLSQKNNLEWLDISKI